MHTPLVSSKFRAVCVLSCLGWLTACGGSSGNKNEYSSYSYLQFYNGSPNGATVYMREVDNQDLGNASFGDATSVVTLDEKGDYELEFYRLDSDDQEEEIDTLTVSLKKGYKTIVVVDGDFSDTADRTFSEYEYERDDDLDGHFRLMATSAMLDNTQDFDLYMSEAGDPFEFSNYLGTISHGTLEEYEYWDGDDDSDDFDEDEYTIYLTEVGGSDVVFESDTIDFAYSTEYVLIMRDISGAIQDGMVMDIMLDSSTVTDVTDVDALSQYRIYNSLDYDSPVTIEFTGDDESETVTIELAAGETSEFTAIDYGDYRISASIGDGSLTESNNKLVTLNQSESKAIIIYEEEGALSSLSFVESSASQAYDKTVNFINLVTDYEDVDFYLVRNDETIDTAEYSVQNVEYEEVDSEVMPADFYEIIAVHEDDNDEQYLLYRLPIYNFDAETNYFVTVEPADNSSGFIVVVND